MEQTLYRWSILLGGLVALLLVPMPSWKHSRPSAMPELARQVLVEQFTSTN